MNISHRFQGPQFGESWFNYEQLYSEFVSNAKDGCKIVEVGCWKGRSISYLAVEAINSGKNIKIYGVDPWDGAGIAEGDPFVKCGKLYELFLANTSGLNITPIRKTSVEGSKEFEDNSLDIIFIDGDHAYESVKEDIIHWYPKLKHGGIISGHDFNAESVRRAVYEFFGESNIEIRPPNCWVFRKV